MRKLDKLLQAAELEYVRRIMPMPYDLTGLSTDMLQKIIKGQIRGSELEQILAPVRFFDTEGEVEAARAAGFKGVAFYGENDLGE